MKIQAYEKRHTDGVESGPRGVQGQPWWVWVAKLPHKTEVWDRATEDEEFCFLMGTLTI